MCGVWAFGKVRELDGAFESFDGKVVNLYKGVVMLVEVSSGNFFFEMLLSLVVGFLVNDLTCPGHGEFVEVA